MESTIKQPALPSAAKKQQTEDVPEWYLRALSNLKPPERLTVSEWADKYRILTEKESNFPGAWKTSRVPYLKGVMDAMSDTDTEEVVFVKPTQVGGTEFLYNTLGYVIMQDPSPCLLVYPSDQLAEFASKNRIQAMIGITDGMVDRYLPNESKMLELQFSGMYLVLTGAQSPSALASRPVRFLLLDEVDKYPIRCGDEADPVSLARERTKTFSYNKKILMASTPTIESNYIWQGYVTADERRHFYVPCPHCGEMQVFEFKNIKWPEGVNEPTKVKDLAWYECPHCKGMIRDAQKMKMLLNGEWRGDKKDKTAPARKVAFHLNSIYSPWVTFGDMAKEFLESKDFPEKLRNFVNSWLGEPFRNKEAQNIAADLMQHQHRWDRGVVPEGAQLLTVGVDVQLNHFWWSVWAWGEKVTGWMVDYGRVETWDELEEIVVDRQYCNEDGEPFYVNLAAIDSGFRTDECYEFCAQFAEVARPIKGSSKRLTSPYSVTTLEKERNTYGGLRLYVLDTHYFKDLLFGRLRKEPTTPGSWSLFRDVPPEVVEHFTSEQKVLMTDRKTGRVIEEYQKVSSHAQNHILDTAVYAAAAAEMADVRYIRSQNRQKNEQNDVEMVENLAKTMPKRVETPHDSWINPNRRGSWW